MKIVNAGINGNPAGFKFYTVAKTLSYTEKPVLIVVPPPDFKEMEDHDTHFENKYHKISTQLSVIKAIRHFFLERAMELETTKTIGDCCVDVVYGLRLGIPGIAQRVNGKPTPYADEQHCDDSRHQPMAFNHPGKHYIYDTNTTSTGCIANVVKVFIMFVNCKVSKILNFRIKTEGGIARMTIHKLRLATAI